MRFRFLFPFAALLLFTWGCDTVDPERPEATGPRLIIGNQGNFSAGDGSISVVNLESWDVTTPIRDLESIVQSIFFYDGRLHVLSNTGRRMDIFHGRSLERLHLTGSLMSPRYGAEFLDRLFVSNLYADQTSYSGGYVSVIDGMSYARIAAIPVGDHPEGVAEQAGRIFVANHGFGFGRTVSMIDPIMLVVDIEIDVDCDGPRFLVPGRGDDLYVTCTGSLIYDENFEQVGSTDGAIRVIDARDGTVRAGRTVEGRLAASDFGQDAFFDAVNNHLYVVADERMVRIYDGTTLNEIGSIGPLAGNPIGAVAFDAAVDRLYLGRVAGFTTAGSVTVHRPDGSLERTIPVGIAPTSLLIRR